MPDDERAPAPLRLLVVCTANQCRSPLGEVLLRDVARRRGVAVEVTSAGTQAIDGAPATDGAITAARKLGVDLGGHLSRPVTPDLVEGAQLVLGMERAHVLDLLNEHGSSLPSTYTLPEFATVATRWPREPTEPVDDWLVRVGRSRTATSVLNAPEIDDPIGRSQRTYHRTAAAIASLVAEIVDAYGEHDPTA